jgi:hypothetical protein
MVREFWVWVWVCGFGVEREDTWHSHPELLRSILRVVRVCERGGRSPSSPNQRSVNVDTDYAVCPKLSQQLDSEDPSVAPDVENPFALEPAVIAVRPDDQSVCFSTSVLLDTPVCLGNDHGVNPHRPHPHPPTTLGHWLKTWPHLNVDVDVLRSQGYHDRRFVPTNRQTDKG